MAVLSFIVFSAGLSHAGEVRKDAVPWNMTSFGDSGLARILRVATFSNPNIPAAIEKVNQAREDVRNAAAGLGPTLNVGGTARYGRNEDEYNASLNLVQTVYSGGTLTANKRAAALALSAMTAESTKTYQEVLNTVRTRYYECLRAWGRVQVAAESLELAKEHLRQAEGLYRSGMAPKGDVLRVKVSVNQAEVEQVSARSELEVSRVALEHAVGAKVSGFEILKPVSGDSIDGLEPPFYREPEDIVARALSQRMELKAYRYYKDRADQLVKSAAGESRPKITFSGRLNTGRDAVSLGDDDWYVQLEAQWVLYDGGALAAAVRKAKAAARELLYVLEDLSSQISQEASQAGIRLASARERLRLAAEQTATAKEDYRLARRRYETQLGSNLDVLDARRALIESMMGYINAVYDIALAQSDLVYAMGDDSPPENFFQGGKKSSDLLKGMTEDAVLHTSGPDKPAYSPER